LFWLGRVDYGSLAQTWNPADLIAIFEGNAEAKQEKIGRSQVNNISKKEEEMYLPRTITI